MLSFRVSNAQLGEVYDVHMKLEEFRYVFFVYVYLVVLSAEILLSCTDFLMTSSTRLFLSRLFLSRILL
jgi:hypothetical protein